MDMFGKIPLIEIPLHVTPDQKSGWTRWWKKAESRFPLAARWKKAP